MEKPVANFLKKVAEDYLPDEDIFIEPEYSGRGMNGQTTFAVICPNVTQLLCACINYANANQTEAELPKLQGFQKDTMGYDEVMY